MEVTNLLNRPFKPLFVISSDSNAFFFDWLIGKGDDKRYIIDTQPVTTSNNDGVSMSDKKTSMDRGSGNVSGSLMYSIISNRTPKTAVYSIRLLIIICVVIFLGESELMFFLHPLFPSMDPLVEGILDAVVLITLVTPILYVLYHKPLIKNVNAYNKTSRILNMLRDCNQSLVRVNNEQEMLNELCRIIVSYGGYRLAWIGLKEQDQAKSVRPVAYHGQEGGYLESIDITWADMEKGHGPTGKAIRTGKPSFAMDIMTDPDFAPWREEALKRGYFSSGAFPLVCKGNVIGALNVFSEDRYPFDESEIQLLTELAGDVAFGIESLRVQKELERSEAKYTDLYENAPDMFALLEFGTGIVLLCNEKLVTASGYARDEIIGHSIFELYCPDCHEKIRNEVLPDFRKTGIISDAELLLQRKDGSLIDVSLNATAVRDENGDIIFSISILRDITERKRAEQQLRKSETMLRISQEIAHIGSWELDLSNQNVHWSDETYKILGLDKERFEPTFEKFMSIVHPDDREKISCIAIESLQKDRIYTMELRVTRPDGVDRVIENRFYAEFDKSDRPVRLVGTNLDITERKLAREMILLNSKRFETLLDISQMSDATLKNIADFTLEKGIELTKSEIGFLGLIDEGESVLTTISYSPMVMKKCEVEVATLDFAVSGSGLWAESIRERKPVIINDYSKSHPNKKGVPEGHIKLVRILAVPIFEGENVVALGIVGNKRINYNQTDVLQLKSLLSGMWQIMQKKKYQQSLRESNEKLIKTINKLKNMQAMVIRSEKLASLGSISAGVAHEIKNPLNIISANVQLIMTDDNLSTQARKSCNAILKQVHRTAKITDNLRDFARERKPEMIRLEIHELINKTIALVEYEMNVGNIVTDRKFRPDPIYIKADPDQLAQVFLNLINNACDSITESRDSGANDASEENSSDGRLTIGTVVEDDNVRIYFKDTGTGMTEDIIKKIFDPFYTTKAEGKGTGLGLSISYGIIENHGGRISVKSEAGKGAVFTVTLPLYHDDGSVADG